jgi:hypothetical protein
VIFLVRRKQGAAAAETSSFPAWTRCPREAEVAARRVGYPERNRSFGGRGEGVKPPRCCALWPLPCRVPVPQLFYASPAVGRRRKRGHREWARPFPPATKLLSLGKRIRSMFFCLLPTALLAKKDRSCNLVADRLAKSGCQLDHSAVMIWPDDNPAFVNDQVAADFQLVSS